MYLIYQFICDKFNQITRSISEIKNKRWKKLNV